VYFTYCAVGFALESDLTVRVFPSNDTRTRKVSSGPPSSVSILSQNDSVAPSALGIDTRWLILSV